MSPFRSAINRFKQAKAKAITDYSEAVADSVKQGMEERTRVDTGEAKAGYEKHQTKTGFVIINNVKHITELEYQDGMAQQTVLEMEGVLRKR